MYKATEEIRKAFEERGLKFRVNEGEKTCSVEAGFKSGAGVNVKIRFISTDDENDVAVRAFQIVSVPEAKRDEVLKKVNELNTQYRYAKFTIDDDGDINVEYDMPVKGANVGECALEMFLRFMKIIDQALPQIMKVIWA